MPCGRRIQTSYNRCTMDHFIITVDVLKYGRVSHAGREASRVQGRYSSIHNTLSTRGVGQETWGEEGLQAPQPIKTHDPLGFPLLVFCFNLAVFLLSPARPFTSSPFFTLTSLRSHAVR
jgi:hypothetical protein